MRINATIKNIAPIMVEKILIILIDSGVFIELNIRLLWQYLQTIASSLTSSAQYGHFFIEYPPTLT